MQTPENAMSYRQVIVFHSGTSPRNNLSNWQTRTMIPKSNKKDFFYHTAKDLAMAEEADCGFMLRDGVSKGTLNNILNLLERSKKVVYFIPARECRTLRQIADVIPLLKHCPKPAMEEFEFKINLTARIAQPQARLNLV